jgi:hypothetical protein
VGGLGGEGPEVPLHVGVAQVGAREALLGVDEVPELDAVADCWRSSPIPKCRH